MLDLSRFEALVRQTNEKLDEVIDRLDRVVELLEDQQDRPTTFTATVDEWPPLTDGYDLD